MKVSTREGEYRQRESRRAGGNQGAVGIHRVEAKECDRTNAREAHTGERSPIDGRFTMSDTHSMNAMMREWYVFTLNLVVNLERFVVAIDLTKVLSRFGIAYDETHPFVSHQVAQTLSRL